MLTLILMVLIFYFLRNLMHWYTQNKHYGRLHIKAKKTCNVTRVACEQVHPNKAINFQNLLHPSIRPCWALPDILLRICYNIGSYMLIWASAGNTPPLSCRETCGNGIICIIRWIVYVMVIHMPAIVTCSGWMLFSSLHVWFNSLNEINAFASTLA